MNVLYFLVPVALALAGIGALAFRWAVNSGQFDDLESPAYRMLIDDEQQPDTDRINEQNVINPPELTKPRHGTSTKTGKSEPELH